MLWLPCITQHTPNTKKDLPGLPGSQLHHAPHTNRRMVMMMNEQTHPQSPYQNLWLVDRQVKTTTLDSHLSFHHDLILSHTLRLGCDTSPAPTSKQETSFCLICIGLWPLVRFHIFLHNNKVKLFRNTEINIKQAKILPKHNVKNTSLDE